MNSSPNIDCNSALSPETGWVHQVHSLGQPVRPWPCERTRSGAVSWPTVDRVAGAQQSCRRPCTRLARPCRGLPHDTMSYLLLPWSQYTTVYYDTIPSATQAATVTIQSLYRDMAFPQAKPASPVTIQILYYDTSPAKPGLLLLCHDTMIVS